MDVIETSLDDDKAIDVVVINLSGKSEIADFMVIATGTSQRMVSTMAQHLLEKLKTAGVTGMTLEGKTNSDWVLLDAGDAIPDVGAEPMPNGGRLNMGHTAGTEKATPGIEFLDINGDGLIDGIDVLRVATSFATSSVDARYSAAADLDDDNAVDGNDLALVCAAFGNTCE